MARSHGMFSMFGLLLTLVGQCAIHAIFVGDGTLLRLIGIYSLGVAVIGVLAFPKSPFWAPLLVSPVIVAAGYGLFD